MGIDTKNFEWEFKTISKLLQNNNSNEILKEISNFVKGEFLEFMEKNLLTNNITLSNEFKQEFNKFCMYVNFNELVGKKIVGLAGALNTGKSSFLNRLMNREILVNGLTTSTAVPTYIVQHKDVKISCLNMFNNIIDISEEEMEKIFYEFEERYNITISDVLNNMVIQLPEQEYSNLVFLDTGGYNMYIKNVAEQLNFCDYILWFVDSENGTIKENDLNFLQTLKKDVPILVIISRSDKKQSSDIEIIKKQVEIVLKERGIFVLDIIPCSSRKVDMYNLNSIKEYLQDWNTEKAKCLNGRNFQYIFDKIQNQFHAKVKKETINFNKINSILINCEQIQDIKKLELAKEKIKCKINKIKLMEKELRVLNLKFFSLLRKVGEKVQLNIYEDADSKENSSIFEIINQYKKENKIKDKGYRNLINIRLYNRNIEVVKNNTLKILDKNSIVYKEMINKKLNNINKSDKLNCKDTVKKIMKDLSCINLNLEEKEKDNIIIKNKMKNLNSKNISWLIIE